MKLICKCGVANRIPSLPTSRIRCGKCKHEFTPMELVKAIQETPPHRGDPAPFDLEIEDDIPFEDEEDEEW